MDKIKELLKSETNKTQLPFNSQYFVSEEMTKRRTVSVKKYQTKSFLPYPNYKPVLFYIDDEL